MRTLIVALLLAFGVPAFADWIIMTPQEQELNERFPASATHDDAVAAFNSRHFVLQQRAIEWLLANRDISTWKSLRGEKEKLKEVSLQLYPILDYVAAQPPDDNKPLALILPQNYFALLVRKGDPIPPRYEYDYLAPPVDESLYQILAEDLKRFPSSNEFTASAARLLLEYRAPSDKLEQSVELKAAPGELTGGDGNNRRNLRQQDRPSGQPTSTSPPPSNQSQATGTSRTGSPNKSTTTWMVAITAAICTALAVGIALRKKS